MSRIAVVLYAVGLVILVNLAASLWHQEQTRRTFRATYQPLYEAAIKSLEGQGRALAVEESIFYYRKGVRWANLDGLIPGPTDTIRIADLDEEQQRVCRILISAGILVDESFLKPRGE